MEWLLARWLTFVASILVVGACGVGVALLPPAAHRSPESLASLTRRTAGIGFGCALALIPAGLVRLLDQLRALQSPGDSWLTGADALLFSTTWGTGFRWQSAAVLGAVCALALLRQLPTRRWLWALACVVAVGLCVTPSLQGHAIGSENSTALAVAADVIHVTGASLWIGSIAIVGWLGLARVTAGGDVDVADMSRSDDTLRALVPLLPPLALSGAAMLAVSGGVSAWLHLQTIADLWTTTWGRYVLGKLALTAVTMALGALNWRRHGPSLGARNGVGALRAALLAELAVALIALLVTALLVVTPLPGE